MAKADLLIEWEAHEYEHKERTQDWFWAVGIITVSLTVASILFGDIIFGIFILVAAFTLSLYINKPPETLQMSIDTLGIKREKVYYPFESLAGFSIDTEHPHKKIFLRSKKTYIPLIVVPLGEDVDPEKIRKILADQLKEEKHTTHLLENILEYLGF